MPTYAACITGSGSVATEDIAELMVQSALRLDRSKADGAQRLRVMRVAPLDEDRSGGLIRPDGRVRVGGLVEATELNGLTGTVMRADDNMDGSVSISGAKAWIVRFDPKLSTPLGKMKRVKADNIQALAPSAEWTDLLAPFGRVRARDPKDPRVLVPEWGPFGE